MSRPHRVGSRPPVATTAYAGVAATPASARDIGRALRQTEKQFAQQVVDLAKMLGWRVYRTWLPIHSPAGFPDLVLVRPPRLIFAELKSSEGKTTPKQDEWLADLRAVAAAAEVPLDMGGRRTAVTVHLWRPTDFDDIARILGSRDVPG